MYVLVAYDIGTTDSEGAKRLRHVAKQCQNYGQRVQNSVFECKVDPCQLAQLEANLQDIIDEKKDNLRIYHLGSEKHFTVEQYGIKKTFNLESAIII